MNSFLLADLLELTKDGEWGQGTPSDETEPMLVIRGTDFADVRYGNTAYVPLRHIPRRLAARKVLLPGDIILETAGGTKDQPTGRTVFLKERMFRESRNRFTCASFSRFLRVKRDIAHPAYLFWYLQNLYNQGEMYPYHVQHTGVARFQYTQFASNQRIECPSLDVQSEIAAVLSELDDKIELNRRMNETLEAIARAIFKDWFVDFGPTRAKQGGHARYLAPEIWALFPDHLDDDGKPQEWAVSTIGQEVDVVGGSTPSTKEPKFWGGGIA